jgi:peroxiredoxin
MLADGGGAFAKAIGHEFDTGDFGGIRLKRLAMLVNVRRMQLHSCSVVVHLTMHLRAH